MADVKEFAKKVAEDKALAEALAKAASKEEFLAKAKEAGFELTEEDLAELAKSSKGELLDDGLEGVAGGYWQSFRPIRELERRAGAFADWNN